MKQDNIFEEMLIMYLNYALTFTNNVFFHDYFFSKKSKNIRLEPLKYALKHYRSFYYSNDILTIEHSFLIRISAGEYFPMRLWKIKYNGWILLLFNCFKPFKLKKFIRKGSEAGEVSSVGTNLKYGKVHLTRFKILYLYLRSFYNQVLNYKF